MASRNNVLSKATAVWLAVLLVDIATSDCPALLDSISIGYSTRTYAKLADDMNVVNPGRGFYVHSETLTSNFVSFDAATVSTEYSVVLRLYYLDTFKTSDLNATFISNIQSDLDNVKADGLMVVLRFAYTSDTTVTDAALQQVLNHIQTLDASNVFRDYEGIIVAIQAGFIGTWGEWHYTNSDFGTVTGCSNDFGLTEGQWDARKQVVQALLDASPTSVDVLVRIPAYKYHPWGNTITTLAIDRAGGDASRIGYHNDAFLSDASNMGTFLCSDDAAYLANDSRFSVVSGESSTDQNSTFYECTTAKSELARYHFSVLNSVYHPGVLEYWRTHGCFDEISARLGYRIFLKDAVLPDAAYSKGEFCYTINLQNDGYAAPYKQLVASLILVNAANGSQYHLQIHGVDVRTWQPGTHISLTGSAMLPGNINGTFTTFFVLAHETMPSDSNYFILMANDNGVQDTTSRMNDLLHTVDISPNNSNSAASIVDVFSNVATVVVYLTFVIARARI